MSSSSPRNGRTAEKPGRFSYQLSLGGCSPLIVSLTARFVEALANFPGSYTEALGRRPEANSCHAQFVIALCVLELFVNEHTRAPLLGRLLVSTDTAP